jgi:hypothetical protein
VLHAIGIGIAWPHAQAMDLMPWHGHGYTWQPHGMAGTGIAIIYHSFIGPGDWDDPMWDVHVWDAGNHFFAAICAGNPSQLQLILQLQMWLTILFVMWFIKHANMAKCIHPVSVLAEMKCRIKSNVKVCPPLLNYSGCWTRDQKD